VYLVDIDGTAIRVFVATLPMPLSGVLAQEGPGRLHTPVA
jgi:hypothetical protein